MIYQDVSNDADMLQRKDRDGNIHTVYEKDDFIQGVFDKGNIVIEGDGIGEVDFISSEKYHGYKAVSIDHLSLINASTNGIFSSKCNAYLQDIDDNGKIHLNIKNSSTSDAKIRVKIKATLKKSTL